jgi:hypothetical protein
MAVKGYGYWTLVGMNVAPSVGYAISVWLTFRVHLLFSVLAGGPLPPGERARVFVSTGTALFDNLTVRYLLGRSRRL